MSFHPQMIWKASALIYFILGIIHLFLTITGNQLVPKDPDLRMRMMGAVLNLEAVNIWKGWLGFNISHSMGLILIAIFSFAEERIGMRIFIVFTSFVYTFLAYRFWFSIPMYALLVATGLFLMGLRQ